MIIQVFGSFVAIMAFGILIECPKKHLKYVGIVGAIGGSAYLLSEYYGLNVVASSFISALCIAFISQTFARKLKTPVTLYLVAGILPTVPGAGMYRTVYYIIAGDRAMSSKYLIETLGVAGTIALAIFIVDALFRVFQRGWKQNSLKYEKNK